MPNKHSAIKELRKNKKRAKQNSRMKTHSKSLVKQLESLVKEGKKAEAAAMASKVQKTLAKAAKNHVYHRNKSAHVTARAQKMVAKMK